MDLYYYTDSEGRQFGPVTQDSLAQLYRTKKLLSTSLVRADSGSAWCTLAELFDLSELRQIDPNQEIEVWSGGPSWLPLIPYFVVLLIVAVVVPFPSGVIPAVVIVPYLVLRHLSTKYRLTNKRAGVTTGILIKSVNEVRISDVRGTRIVRSGLAGLFGAGDVCLSTAAGSGEEVVFACCDQPRWVHDQVKRLQPS